MTDNSMKIPLLDLKAQYETIKEEIDEALHRVVQTQHFILGPEVTRLENAIADYSQSRYGIGVSSGTDALLLALMVLGIGQGDEVITTSYTFFATAGAIARVGATPVFVDIDPHTYNIDTAKIRERITHRTRAIIPVHLYGQMADMDAIMDIAHEFNLYVIEDAAQAIGAEYHGKRAGSIGHMGCFSFFPSKNLGGFGDGGMVVTQDPSINDKLLLYRNHGYKPKYYNAVIGGNFRLDAIQAAILNVKLKYLDQWTSARQRNADLYRKLFTEIDLDLESLRSGALGLVLPVLSANNRHIYNQFVIRCSKRDDLMQYLKAEGISTEVYYPCPMHLQECFQNLGYSRGDIPESELAANETLAFPIYPELDQQAVAYVVERTSYFYSAASQYPAM